MIKCNVTINGIVSRTASMRTNKEEILHRLCREMTIPAKAGSSKQVEVFVSKDGRLLTPLMCPDSASD